MKEMKETKIEWIGEIPSSWKTCRLKYVTKQIIDGTHNTPTYVNDGIPFLRVTDITSDEQIDKPINLDNVARIPIEEHKELIKRCKPEKGDLLVSKNGTIGVPKVIDWEWEFSTFVSLCLIKTRNFLSNKFLYYYFKSNLIDAEIAFGGKTNTITNLHLEKIANFIIPLPTFLEQQKISDFLDVKVKKIDSIIVDLNKQVKILMEYKKSLIIEKITKGLDTNSSMKDIKSDLIDKIPHNWRMVRMQDIGEYKKGPFGSAITIEMFVEKSENTYKVYEQKNAINHDETLGWYYIDENDFRRLKDFEIFPGDIIVSCAGTMGKCHILPNTMEKGIINQALMKISLNNDVNKFYFLYLFDIVIEKISDKYSNGSAIKNIPPFSILKKYKIPCPPIDEQQRIVDYLDKKCFQIDELIKDKQTQIEKMEKYKKSLIYEYVTGKKRVKGAEELYG